MAQQTGKNIVVAYKVEAALNTAPGDTGGKVLRLTPSPGLSLQKESIQSNEIRADGLTSISRHGSRSVSGSYSGELSVASFDTPLEAIARSTLIAAATITEASSSLASITFGTNTVVATNTSGGGFVAAGIRVGDVFRVSGTSGPNNNLNAQVRAVATHTITVGGGTFTAEATAITSFSLTVGTKLKNGASPVRRSFYVEQYNKDLDLTQVFGGVRFTGWSLSGSPNGMAEFTLNALGMSSTALAGGASPYFTDPVAQTSRPLVFADAKIGFAGSDITIATAFEATYELAAEATPVIGSDTVPNVFDNEARLSGSLSVLREDLDFLTAFADEDELELTILLQEPGTAPLGYIGLFIPKLKIMGLEAPLGSDGAMVETLTWEAGAKAATTGYDATLFTMTTHA